MVDNMTRQGNGIFSPKCLVVFHDDASGTMTVVSSAIITFRVVIYREKQRAIFSL